MLPGETVELDDGTTGSLWTEPIEIADPAVTVLATYTSGDQAGSPAITRWETGRGAAAYVSTRLGAARLETVLGKLPARLPAGSSSPSGPTGEGVLVPRQSHDGAGRSIRPQR